MKQPPDTAEADRDVDFSAEVAATIEREMGDQVRCTKIGGSRYRCNWWALRTQPSQERGAVSVLAATMVRVRKSRVLHVTRSAAGLHIAEAPERNQ